MFQDGLTGAPGSPSSTESWRVKIQQTYQAAFEFFKQLHYLKSSIEAKLVNPYNILLIDAMMSEFIELHTIAPARYQKNVDKQAPFILYEFECRFRLMQDPQFYGNYSTALLKIVADFNSLRALIQGEYKAVTNALQIHAQAEELISFKSDLSAAVFAFEGRRVFEKPESIPDIEGLAALVDDVATKSARNEDTGKIVEQIKTIIKEELDKLNNCIAGFGKERYEFLIAMPAENVSAMQRFLTANPSDFDISRQLDLLAESRKKIIDLNQALMNMSIRIAEQTVYKTYNDRAWEKDDEAYRAIFSGLNGYINQHLMSYLSCVLAMLAQIHEGEYTLDLAIYPLVFSSEDSAAELAKLENKAIAQAVLRDCLNQALINFLHKLIEYTDSFKGTATGNNQKYVARYLSLVLNQYIAKLEDVKFFDRVYLKEAELSARFNQSLLVICKDRSFIISGMVEPSGSGAGFVDIKFLDDKWLPFQSAVVSKLAGPLFVDTPRSVPVSSQAASAGGRRLNFGDLQGDEVVAPAPANDTPTETALAFSPPSLRSPRPQPFCKSLLVKSLLIVIGTVVGFFAFRPCQDMLLANYTDPAKSWRSLPNFDGKGSYGLAIGMMISPVGMLVCALLLLHELYCSPELEPENELSEVGREEGLQDLLLGDQACKL